MRNSKKRRNLERNSPGGLIFLFFAVVFSFSKVCNQFNMYFGSTSASQNSITKYEYTFTKSEQTGSISWTNPPDFVAPNKQFKKFFRSEYDVSGCKLTKTGHSYGNCRSGPITINNEKYNSYTSIIYQNASNMKTQLWIRAL